MVLTDLAERTVAVSYHRLKVGWLPASSTGLAETPEILLKYSSISIEVFVSTGVDSLHTTGWILPTSRHNRPPVLWALVR